MGLRFSRRVSLIPGLRLNFSRAGVSLSIGHRGAWYTIGPRGRRVTVGLPGSGLYWTETAPPASARRLFRRASIPPAPPPHAGHKLAFAAVVVAGLVSLYLAFGGR